MAPVKLKPGICVIWRCDEPATHRFKYCDEHWPEVADDFPPDDCCGVCGDLLKSHPGKPNVSGFCSKNAECKSAMVRVSKQRKGTKGDRYYLTATDARDLETGELIIDNFAIDSVIRGKPVALTPSEREIAVRQMVRFCYGQKQIATCLGTTPKNVREILDKLGYEIVHDNLRHDASKATTIRKKRN